MREKKWHEIAAKAQAYLDLGQDEHYLYDNKWEDFDLPMQYVQSVEPSGSIRWDIHTSVKMTAVHPSGLKFTWYFEIEHPSANGQNKFIIDIERCRKVMATLPPVAKEQFAKYLRDCAHTVSEKAGEHKKLVAEQYQMAEDLMKAARL